MKTMVNDKKGNQMIELTAAQIKQLDEIKFDKRALEEAFKLHLTYHTNRINELDKAEKAWWGEIAAIHGLDLSKNVYKVDTVKNRVSVIEKTPDERS